MSTCCASDTLLCAANKTQPLLISKKKRNYTVQHLRESVEKFGLKEKLVLCKKKRLTSLYKSIGDLGVGEISILLIFQLTLLMYSVDLRSQDRVILTFSKCLLITYYMPGIVPGPGDTVGTRETLEFIAWWKGKKIKKKNTSDKGYAKN